jgi:nucleotide-binding universal stress UspA family protein
MGNGAETIKTIAVGFDGSETADTAVDRAAEVARRFGARLVLLGAFSDSASKDGDAEDVELQWTWRPYARLKTTLERKQAALRRQGVECDCRLEEGDPADVLLALTRECDADLLVIGNKGMKRRLLGSVPNTLTHKAECSVLVVKTT